MSKNSTSPTRPQKPLESRIGWSNEHDIRIYGLNLMQDLMGKQDLGAMAFLELTSRLPTPSESVLVNAMLVALVEHGITPSALATRMTYYGAPESLQGAVAAGLLGLGNVFVGTIEGSAKMLQESLAEAGDTPDFAALATELVNKFRATKQILPGFGHPIHRPDDPRALRLLELAREQGHAGKYVQLLLAVSAEADRQFGKHLVLNVTGMIGAIASELDISWRYARGLGIMARAVGLIGHIREELERPIAPEIWVRVGDEAVQKLRADEE
jgi:citrate synthase